MSNNKEVLISGSAYIFSSFIISGMAFLTTPLFTRLMSQEEFGLYNNFISWVSILTVILSLNLGASFISAKYDWKDEFDIYFFSMITLSFFIILLALITTNLFSKYVVRWLDMNLIYINLLLIYILFSQVITMYQSKSQFEFKYKNSVMIGVLVSVSSTILAILLVANTQDKLFGRIIGYTIPSIIIGGCIFAITGIKAGKIKIVHWKYAIPLCLPYIPHSLSLSMLNSIDRIMITKICGEKETALYSLAYTCSSVITILMSSMNAAYCPWLVRNLNAKRNREIRNFSYFYISIFIFLVLGIMLIAPELLEFLGGKKYFDAVFVMPPVMMGCAMQLLYTMHVNIEQFYKKTVGMALASIVAALFNFVLNQLFIPYQGYIAAAYTTFISYFVLLILHIWLVKKMKLDEIYDYKFITVIVIMMYMIMFGMTFLYYFKIVRYIIIGSYILCGIVAIYTNRGRIIEILKK